MALFERRISKESINKTKMSIGCYVIFPPCKNPRDLKTSTEGLIEEQASLKLGNKGKP